MQPQPQQALLPQQSSPQQAMQAQPAGPAGGKTPKFRSKLGEQRAHQRVGSASQTGEDTSKMPSFMSTKYHSGLSTPQSPNSPQEETAGGQGADESQNGLLSKQAYQQSQQRSSLQLQGGLAPAPPAGAMARRSSMCQPHIVSDATPKSPQTSDSSTPISPLAPRPTMEQPPAEEAKQPHELLIEQQEDYETDVQGGQQPAVTPATPITPITPATPVTPVTPVTQPQVQPEVQKTQPQVSEADMYYEDVQYDPSQQQQPMQGLPPNVQPPSIGVQVPLPQVGSMASAGVPLPGQSQQVCVSTAVPLPLNLSQVSTYNYDDDDLYGESTSQVMPGMLLPPPPPKDANASASSAIPPVGLGQPQQFFTPVQTDPNMAMYMQQCDYDDADMYGA